MRVGIFHVLENHLHFFLCGLLFMVFAHFPIELLVIFLLIHSSLLYIEDPDQ